MNIKCVRDDLEKQQYSSIMDTLECCCCQALKGKGILVSPSHVGDAILCKALDQH